MVMMMIRYSFLKTYSFSLRGVQSLIISECPRCECILLGCSNIVPPVISDFSEFVDEGGGDVEISFSALRLWRVDRSCK